MRAQALGTGGCDGRWLNVVRQGMLRTLCRDVHAAAAEPMTGGAMPTRTVSTQQFPPELIYAMTAMVMTLAPKETIYVR